MARSGNIKENEVNVVTSLLKTLSQMSFCCPKSLEIQARYADAVSRMTSAMERVPSKFLQEDLNFTDCHLSDAHIIILFEILRIAKNQYQNNILLLTGEQNFSPTFLAENIIKMLEISPNAIYNMHLPEELRSNRRIQELWSEFRARGKDPDRGLIFGDAPAAGARAGAGAAGVPILPAARAAADPSVNENIISGRADPDAGGGPGAARVADRPGAGGGAGAAAAPADDPSTPASGRPASPSRR